MMFRAFVFALSSLSLAAAHASPAVPQLRANGVGVRAYSEGAVYDVAAAPGAVTDIALEPGEGLIAVASGDTLRWVIGDTTSGNGATRRTHILVKPTAAGLATNLVVTTDRRVYHLALTSRHRAPIVAISWSYPQDALLALSRPPVASDREPAAPPLDRLRFGYRISGDRVDWRPVRAFDDGRQTYIEFPRDIAAGEAPPLFVMDAGVGPELVNYRMRGRFYIVDRLFDAAELRLGTRRQKVVRIARIDADRKHGKAGR